MGRFRFVIQCLIPLAISIPTISSAALTSSSPTISSGGGVSSRNGILVTSMIGEPVTGYSRGSTISISAGFAAAVANEPTTAVSAVLDHLELSNGHVHASWRIDGASSLLGVVQRRQDGGEWTNLTVPTPISGHTFVYDDGSIVLGARYDYRLFLQDQTGSWYTNEASILIPSTPLISRMRRVAPNPFRSQTSIWFDVARPSRTTIRIFNATGRLVRTLTDAVLAPNQYKYDWDGSDTRGHPAAAGIYFCLFESGATRETTRITLLK